MVERKSTSICVSEKPKKNCQPILMFGTVLYLKSFDNFQLYLLLKKIIIK